MKYETHDDEFADRLARPLRAPERVDAGFEARVMSAVQHPAAGRGRGSERSWWVRPDALRLSPLTSLALAAALAIVMFGAGALVAGRNSSSAQRAATPDTVHVVRFVYADSTARSVMIVGEFNQWTKGATALHRDASGIWTVELPLAAGRHEYAFVVYDDARGERWVADPLAQLVRDDFGTQSSIVSVGHIPTS